MAELTIDEVVRKIGEIGIVPVVRASSVEEANRAVEAICAGGIPVVEITMTVPNAVSVIRELVQQRGGDVLIGAGTVTNAEQAESCVRAGAQFLVSPGLASSVLSVARVHACSYPVDQLSNEEEASPVSQLKGENDVAVPNLAPSKLRLQRRLQ